MIQMGYGASLLGLVVQHLRPRASGTSSCTATRLTFGSEVRHSLRRSSKGLKAVESEKPFSTPPLYSAKCVQVSNPNLCLRAGRPDCPVGGFFPGSVRIFVVGSHLFQT